MQLLSSDSDRSSATPSFEGMFIIDASKLRALRAIAVQAPIIALPLSRPLRERATTLGYVKISDVTSVSWLKIVQDLGLAGASEIKHHLTDCDLAPSSWT